jgi:PhoH-like ATPase
MSKQTESKSNKIFVIDTSVILYDHKAIYNFEDNDIALPITVFEELDDFKKGNDTINFEAREFIRSMDRLAAKSNLKEWLSIGKGKGKLKVIMSENNGDIDATAVFRSSKPDHFILNAALTLIKENPDKKVILVSKDINLRLKAKSLNLNAEDYLTGKIKDTEKLITGRANFENIDDEVINKLFQTGFCTPQEIGLKDLLNNKYLVIKGTKSSALAYYSAKRQRVERIDKETCYKITPRNAEQTFAMHALLNPDVKLVSLQGVAGTGKTLLALAGALQQKRDFKQIYLARPIVPLSNSSIGYLPGDVDSKISVYMIPIWDNLKFIQSQYKESDKEYKFIQDCVKDEKLIITPLAYIRGRSISNVFFIIDESQNLTPHEVKTIVTRAGEGTKIVFTGDINQIDSPYLDAQSNGLSHLIDKIKNQPIYSHVTLEKGERSELANIANELL